MCNESNKNERDESMNDKNRKSRLVDLYLRISRRMSGLGSDRVMDARRAILMRRSGKVASAIIEAR